jgi:hypothetical protein
MVKSPLISWFQSCEFEYFYDFAIRVYSTYRLIGHFSGTHCHLLMPHLEVIVFWFFAAKSQRIMPRLLKLIVIQLLNIFPVSSGGQGFVTVFTRDCH